MTRLGSYLASYQPPRAAAYVALAAQLAGPLATCDANFAAASFPAASST